MSLLSSRHLVSLCGKFHGAIDFAFTRYYDIKEEEKKKKNKKKKKDRRKKY